TENSAGPRSGFHPRSSIRWIRTATGSSHSTSSSSKSKKNGSRNRMLLYSRAVLVVGLALVLCAPVPRALAEGVPAARISPAELAEGWVSLFDGQSLFGWKANSDLNWAVRDGAISADKGRPGLLLTTFELADYEFRCDYRLEKGGNSGIFLRTPFLPKDPAKDCYEFNMCDSHPAFPTGSIVGRKRADVAFLGDGKWTSIWIRAEGPRITARLDGRQVIDFTDRSAYAQRRGHIGLQMNGGAVAFRNVALRPLGTKELFNGSNLA